MTLNEVIIDDSIDPLSSNIINNGTRVFGIL